MSSWDPIDVIAKNVQNGLVSAVDNVKKSLKLIDENDKYKSIIAKTEKRALARAAEIDEAVKSGKEVGRLAGVPFIAKDNFLVYGADTTAASNILKGFDAPYQSSVIDKLEEQGAICVAKANLDAFAHGSSTENSDFFTTLNPVDETRVPGGSSGGSAAATALGLAPFSLGTDTGGSIRLPASYCGVVGYKPTYGLVSRSGVVAMGSSLDVIGPITNSVRDACIIMDQIVGKDGLDSTMIDPELPYSELAGIDVKKLKVGVISDYMDSSLDPEVKAIIAKQIDLFQSHGAEVEYVDMPSLKYGLGVYYIICPAEVSSNLSRYDGQRFGYSYPEAKDLDDSYKGSRSRGFGDEAKRRILIGTYVLSSGFYDAYYQKAQLVRTKIINEFSKAFSKFDILIGPTAPSTAFKIGQNVEDPLQMYLTDIMTVSANLAGIPAVSIPVGEVDGLPVGMQIMADQKQDKKLLEVAMKIEEWRPR